MAEQDSGDAGKTNCLNGKPPFHQEDLLNPPACTSSSKTPKVGSTSPTTASGQRMLTKAGISAQRKPPLRLQQAHRLADLTSSAISFKSQESSSSPCFRETARAPARCRELVLS